MKRVLMTTKVLYVDDLNNSQIIGIEMKDGKKGQVRKIKRNLYAAIQVGHSNDYEGECVTGSSIQNLIENIGHDEINKIYVFDSKEEILEWFK